MTLKHLRLSTFVAATLAGLSSGSARSELALGTAVNYGVLTGPNIHNFQLTSDTTINGTVGIGSSPNGIQLGGGTITGDLDNAGTVAGAPYGGTVNGTINQNVADVTNAYNTVKSLSNTLAGESGTTLTSSLIVGGVLQATSGTLDGNGNYVFTIAANKFSGLGSFTINGTGAQNVVINITGNQNFNFSNGIALSGGLNDDNVLYNITGTGNIGAAANKAVVNGDIVGINATFNMDAVVIDGRIIGGASGADFQLVSNFTLNQPSSTPVPEPSSLALTSLAGGICCLVYRRRRSRTR
jgi:hypothetical protein